MTNAQTPDAYLGRNVVDAEGNKIGSVGQVYVNDQSGVPDWITVNTGLFGMKENFVPLQGSNLQGDDELVVPFGKDVVKDAPNVEDASHLDVDEQQDLYTYYQQYLTSTGDSSGTAGAGTAGEAQYNAPDTSANAADNYATPGTTDDKYTAAEAQYAAHGDGVEASVDTSTNYDTPTGYATATDYDTDTTSDSVTTASASGDAGYGDRTADDTALGYGTATGADSTTGSDSTGYNTTGSDTTRSDTTGYDTSGPTTDDAMTRSEEHLNVGTQRVESGRARLRKYVVTEQQTVTVPVSHEEVRIEREPITDTNRDAAFSGPEISEEEHEVVLHAETPVVTTEAVAVERVRLGTETVTDNQTVSGEVRKEQIEVDGADGADSVGNADNAGNADSTTTYADNR